CCPTDTKPAYPASRFHRLAKATNVNISARSRSVCRSPQYGANVKTTRAAPISTTPMRLDGVACPTSLIPTPSEKALAAAQQGGQKTREHRRVAPNPDQSGPKPPARRQKQPRRQGCPTCCRGRR